MSSSCEDDPWRAMTPEDFMEYVEEAAHWDSDVTGDRDTREVGPYVGDQFPDFSEFGLYIGPEPE